MLTKLWDLAFEIDGDNIDLEQDMGCGDVARVTLHRVHLRHLAEQAGLIRAGAHDKPDVVIARLSRQIRTLATRIKHLDECIWAVSAYGREDLDHECSFSTATLDLADEFVADLDAAMSDEGESVGLRREAASATRAAAGATADLAPLNTTKNGAASPASAAENGGAQGQLLLAPGDGPPVANTSPANGKRMADAIGAPAP